MKFILCFILIFGSQLSFSTSNAEELNYSQIFEHFWNEAKSTIYPKEKEQKFFTDANKLKLLKKIKKQNDIDKFALIINDFLASLKISHTHFYTQSDQSYYFLKSLFFHKNPSEPKIFHIGIETQKTKNNLVIIRSVLDGYPADLAGLKKGDILSTVNDKPFHPIWSFTEDKIYQLKFYRNNKIKTVQVKPVHESIHLSYLNATKNSTKIYKLNEKKIGYIHLWTGTSTFSPQILKEEVINKLLNTDGIILDLRDGFGGAWWDHLEPFYPDRSTFYTATWIDRNGKSEVWKPEQKLHKVYYSGPIVVLINKGVRSGKEALAYQFKKDKRAILVGEKTAGYFVGGKGLLIEKNNPYLLYLSSTGLLLDGIDIEGIGIEPDVQIKYPIEDQSVIDPQLEKSIDILLKKIVDKNS